MVLLEIAVVVVIVLALAVFVAIYNGLIGRRNRVQDAWAQIDVQLKRRYDLIPNLISTVKGYMKYEKSVLTQVTALRSSIVTGTAQQKAQANDQLSQALKSIFAVAENYPDLKASQTFQNLQEELEWTENKIAFVRTAYNDNVMEYNNSLQQFPSNVVANMFHFQTFDYFKAPDAAQEPVKVDFDDVNAQISGDAPESQSAAPASAQKGKKRGRKPASPPPPPASKAPGS